MWTVDPAFSFGMCHRLECSEGFFVYFIFSLNVWKGAHRLDLGFTLAPVPYLLSIYSLTMIWNLRSFCVCMSYCVVSWDHRYIRASMSLEPSHHDQFWERRG